MAERVALVTGGSRGIGRAVCVALARRGPVAVNYRARVDEAKETLSLVEEEGGEGIVVEADVTDPSRVEAMFDRVEDALGSVSILVNNAGIRSDALTARMSDEAWNEVVQTSLFGTFVCSRRALRAMIRARWGRIVNIASVAGVHGNPGQVNYGAAKGGVIGLTRSLAREVARKSITVNAVAPGLVHTDLTATLTDERTNEILSEIPMGRAGTPEEIAHLVTFLCSERASYVTGAVVMADGGMTA
jgi:3-oxoacyl-[acyl-carrier protein] reductase